MGILKKWWIKFSTGTRIYKYTNIYKTAKIGRNCVIGSYVEIGDGVVIGDRCKIQAQAFIPKGVTIGNDVFIGPSCRFTNDKYPKAKGEWKVWKTTVKEGASIGAGSTILCGITIGRNAMIGAGSVVTKDVLDNECVIGYAAKRHENSTNNRIKT